MTTVHMLGPIYRIALTISAVALVVKIKAAGGEFYRSTYQGAPESYAACLANMAFLPFFYVAFITWGIQVLNREFRRTDLLVLLYFVLTVVIFLVLGDRDPVAKIAVAATFLVSVFRYRIRWWQLVILCVVAGLVFGFAGDARSSDERTLGSWFKKGMEEQSMREKSIVSYVEPLVHFADSSIPSTLTAVAAVPEQREYFYGYFTLRGLLGVLPFSHRLFFSEVDEDYQTSSWYLTSLVIGAIRGCVGTGTTMISELYLDFGLPGVVGGMLAFGAAVGICYSRFHDEEGLIDDIVLYTIVLMLLAVGARNGLGSMLSRGIGWCVLVYFLVKYWVLQLARLRNFQWGFSE